MVEIPGCSRCGRERKFDPLEGWLDDDDAGTTVCPDCFTPEEAAYVAQWEQTAIEEQMDFLDEQERKSDALDEKARREEWKE
jgi:hypothetical protein